MPLKPVTDSEVLKQLNASAPKLVPVKDESVLFELNNTKPEPSEGINWHAAADTALDTGNNLITGTLSGAANIGATILTPLDKLLGVTDRRKQLREFFNEQADPSSTAFKVGELGAEIAGTAGVGGTLAKGVRATGALPKLASAIETGGFRLGAAPAATTAGRVGDLATRAAGGAITGGATAGLINPEYAPTGAVIGGAMAPAVLAAGTVGKGIRNALIKQASPEVAALANRAKELGIDIPADRLTNSRPLNAVASSLEYVPLSGRAASQDKLMSQFNRAVAKTVGESTDNVTHALRKAETRLGQEFDRTLSGNGVVYDDALLADMTKNLDEARATLSEGQIKQIENITNSIFDKAKRVGDSLQIEGNAAYNIKKTLDRIGRSADTELAYHARELKRSLMDALNRSLGPAEAAKFATVRQQYGNMLALENVAKRGAEGGVSVGKLANLKNINNKDLSELADIAAQFLVTRESPHGAAQRVVLGALGATATLQPHSIPLIAGGMAAGRAANSALNSNTVKSLILNPAQTPNYRLLSDPVARSTVYDLISRSNQAGQQ